MKDLVKGRSVWGLGIHALIFLWHPHQHTKITRACPTSVEKFNPNMKNMNLFTLSEAPK